MCRVRFVVAFVFGVLFWCVWLCCVDVFRCVVCVDVISCVSVWFGSVRFVALRFGVVCVLYAVVVVVLCVVLLLFWCGVV